LRDGVDRLASIRSALIAAEIDAVVCTLPSNVLLLSGYWPVVGTSLSVATRAGDVALVMPEDEASLAGTGWTPDISTYGPGSLDSLDGPAERIIPALGQLLHRLDITTAILAVEMGPIYEESSYSAMFRFQAAVRSVLRKAAPYASLTSADQVIRLLRYRLTGLELDRVRLVCRLTGDAFVAGREAVRPGAREPEVASVVTHGLGHSVGSRDGKLRTHPPRRNRRQTCTRRRRRTFARQAVEVPSFASLRYAVTGNREICAGDLVLIHANPFVDGYFADVTRTYVVGMPDGQTRAMYDAVLAAREAALTIIRPGVAASAVDRSAREIIQRAGFGEFFWSCPNAASTRRCQAWPVRASARAHARRHRDPPPRCVLS
jgi:Xaa-Pro dipeptidase